MRLGEAGSDPSALAKPSSRSAVAVKLAASYNDWAVSELAKELGNTGIQQICAQSQKLQKPVERRQNAFMPKDDKDEWVNIDPKVVGQSYYNENNGYTYKWGVTHDIEGLMELMGGSDKFEAELDQLFREGLGSCRKIFLNRFPDMTGLIGQFAMGDQCSFQKLYFFNYTKSRGKRKNGHALYWMFISKTTF